jgi:hypothetical protein
MKYDINLKNIKQSAVNLGEYLKEFNIPHNKILEGFSRSLFYKNWNTLQGVSTKPQIIEHLDVEKRYLFEIEANITREKLSTILKEAFAFSKAQLELITLLQDGNYFHIALDLRKSDTNILTAMFVFAERLKPYDVKKFDYCRIVCEKESFMQMYR